MSDKILKFSATWCQPCKMLATTLQGEDLGVPVEDVDIDQQEDLTKEYGIRGVPTMVLIRNGEEKARISGYNTINKIRDWINAN